AAEKYKPMQVLDQATSKGARQPIHRAIFPKLRLRNGATTAPEEAFAVGGEPQPTGMSQQKTRQPDSTRPEGSQCREASNPQPPVQGHCPPFAGMVLQNHAAGTPTKHEGLYHARNDWMHRREAAALEHVYGATGIICSHIQLAAESLRERHDFGAPGIQRTAI